MGMVTDIGTSSVKSVGPWVEVGGLLGDVRD